MESRERVITSRKSFKEYWSEIFEYKELFWILAKRDVIVRYKQTVLGVAWAAIRPMITALVMVFAFGKVAKLGDNSPIPYMLVVMPGVITWLFFSQSLTQISNSLLLNTNLVTKVYFPRLIIPLSSFLIGLIDALIAFTLFLAICLYYGYSPDYKIFLFPLILILTYFSAFGIGLIAAVLNVKFRDIGQIVPFVIQFGYIASPVAYTTAMIENYKSLYVLNPLAGLIDLMRWALLGDYTGFSMTSFLPMIVFLLVFFIWSFIYFRKHENSFVDYI